MLSSLSLSVCALVCGVFWRVYIFWRERVGLSSRSRFPAFVFCFMFYFMLSYFCLACVSLCFLLFLFEDVFKSTMWSNLQAAVPPDDHHLRALADSLPDVTLAGGAPSATPKYSAIYARWKRWARDHDLPAFPASPYHFASYLRHLMAVAKTASPIESAVHGIPWVHHLTGERCPSEHSLGEGCPCWYTTSFGPPYTSKKEPITVAQLLALSMASLYDIRSVLICLLAFAAFRRFDELTKLVSSDVELDSEKLQLFIESSKTDKYRDGAWVVVAVPGKVTCPVNMMNRYLDKA